MDNISFLLKNKQLKIAELSKVKLKINGKTRKWTIYTIGESNPIYLFCRQNLFRYYMFALKNTDIEE